MLAYVYKITNKVSGEFYIGSRTKNVNKKLTPEEDIGVCYFTSGLLKTDFKNNPTQYDIKIMFRSNHSIFEEFDVVFWYEQFSIRENIGNKLLKNVRYYDPHTYKSKFGTSNLVVVKNSDGKNICVSNTDVRFTSGNLKQVTAGKFNVVDSAGNIFMTSKDDPMFLRGEVTSIHKGKILTKDKDGNIFYIDKLDARFTSGELVGINKGLKVIQNIITKESKKIPKDDITPAGWKPVGAAGMGELLKGKKREVVLCPHCGKSGGINAMKRYHLENCKMKK